VQVWPTGQVTATPVSTQLAGVTPGVPQSSEPTLHGFAVGTQEVPATHAEQVPERQTPPDVPQVAASARKLVSLHTVAPLGSHVVAAEAAHGLALVQATPGVQSAQEPVALHWPVLVPDVQVVPAGWYVWSWHTGAPLEHETEDVRAQGLLEVQAAPAVQAVQIPVAPLHTPVTVPEAQAVPAGW
jgi:hypothetical protein